MVVLPPGALLQLMYFEERLKRWRPGRFIEIVSVAGDLYQCTLLLKARWSSIIYDMNSLI